MVFARFDPRQIGPRLPPAAPRVLHSSLNPSRAMRAAFFAERQPLARFPGAHHPRLARQPRRPGREGFRARSTLKSAHWTDLTPPGRGRVVPRQARPDLPAIGVRRIPCLPPCGVQQSGRAFPHRGTAYPTLGPLSLYRSQSAQAVLRQTLKRSKALQILTQSLATSRVAVAVCSI